MAGPMERASLCDNHLKDVRTHAILCPEYYSKDATIYVGLKLEWDLYDKFGWSWERLALAVFNHRAASIGSFLLSD